MKSFSEMREKWSFKNFKRDSSRLINFWQLRDCKNNVSICSCFAEAFIGKLSPTSLVLVFFLKKGVPNTTRHRYTGMSFYRDFSKCLHYKNGKFKLNFYTSHGKENENVRRNLCYTCDHESINQKTLAK